MNILRKFIPILILISLLVNVFSVIIYSVKAEDIDNKINNQIDNNIDNDIYNEIENENIENNIIINDTIDDSENDSINGIINDTTNNDFKEDASEDINEVENETKNEVINEEIIDNETIENESTMSTIEEQGEVNQLGITYRTHVQDMGWQKYKKDGEMSGTSGKALRLEGINIELLNSDENLNVKYQVHVQDIGWQSWKKNGEMAGTSGKALRLEAIRINLEDSDEYSIMYRVHVQNIGWQGWKIDGEMAGTSGQALRLEAIEIKIVPKKLKGKLHITSPSSTNVYYSISTIEFKGWKMANVSNSYIKAYIDDIQVDSSLINYYNRTDITNDFGTSTQNPKPGFKFSLDVADLSSGKHTFKVDLYYEDKVITSTNTTFTLDKDMHVSYRSHVQDVGWQSYVSDGNLSGTSGKAYRLEAMNIKLINVPEDAKILYRTHVQNIGWQGWKSNNELTGTSGQALRLEAIEIKLQNLENYSVEYKVHIQDIGWTDWYIDGQTAGTVGKFKRLEAIKIRIVPHYEKNYKGIDVSQYNGNINWGFVKRDNVDFAFIRVGIRGYGQAGNFAEDKMFKKNIEAAKTAGIPVGVYFITQAITDEEAIEEANWVLQKIKQYDIQYPVAIDIEEPGLEKPTDIPRTQNLDNATRTRLAKLFCKTIKDAGYTPIVYTNVDWAVNKLNMSELAEYDTWIAHYKYDANSKPSYNKPYTIWQYSDKGSVNGILGNVDLNISYKKYY